MKNQKKSWADLSTGQKVGLVVLGTLQMALLAATLWDIKKTPADDIRGDKRIWVGVAFINWFGPLAYFAAGRKDGLRGLMERCGCCRSGEEI